MALSLFSTCSTNTLSVIWDPPNQKRSPLTGTANSRTLSKKHCNQFTCEPSAANNPGSQHWLVLRVMRNKGGGGAAASDHKEVGPQSWGVLTKTKVDTDVLKRSSSSSVEFNGSLYPKLLHYCHLIKTLLRSAGLNTQVTWLRLNEVMGTCCFDACQRHLGWSPQLFNYLFDLSGIPLLFITHARKKTPSLSLLFLLWIVKSLKNSWKSVWLCHQTRRLFSVCFTL